MRRNSKIDRNQPEIVRALRQVGATVKSLSAVRDGCPDLLVGYQGRNLLLEVKDGNAQPSQQKLTPDEKRFHAEWNGVISVVGSVEEALRAVMMR